MKYPVLSMKKCINIPQNHKNVWNNVRKLYFWGHKNIKIQFLNIFVIFMIKAPKAVWLLLAVFTEILYTVT